MRLVFVIDTSFRIILSREFINLHLFDRNGIWIKKSKVKITHSKNELKASIKKKKQQKWALEFDESQNKNIQPQEEAQIKNCHRSFENINKKIKIRLPAREQMKKKMRNFRTHRTDNQHN